MPTFRSRTLYDKIWDAHIVAKDGSEAIIYIDLHLLHEVTSPQAFAGLDNARRGVRRADLTLSVSDHNVPTKGQALGIDRVADPEARAQLQALVRNTGRFRVENIPMGDPRSGIVHVVAPEQGRTQPSMTIVCGDSHTSTHGALGALAFGIGTSEVEHVLATQTLRQRKSKNMQISVQGRLDECVSAKDLALFIIRQLGVDGATGHVIEYTGDVVRSLSIEARMTLCNLSIEMGARAGLVAPDATTIDYLRGKPAAPRDDAWQDACRSWAALRSDDDAHFDAKFEIDAADVQPMVTWGTNPAQVIAIDALIPDPILIEKLEEQTAAVRALAYMGLEPNTPIAGLPIDRVFIGSCTNSRIEDLRIVANIVRGRRVSPHVKAMVVPGSGLVKRQAEVEGIDKILRDAGFDWREPGCSMCVGMNADKLLAGERCVATSNRNFENRQGRGGLTHLASPAVAAASAIAGVIFDPRELD